MYKNCAYELKRSFKISKFIKYLKQKLNLENKKFKNSIEQVSNALNFNNEKFNNYKNNKSKTNQCSFSINAIYEILEFFKIKPEPIPVNLKKIKHKIKFLINSSNIATRTIKLEPNWFKHCTGAIIAQKKADKTLVALIPSPTLGHYYYTDFNSQKKIKINKKNWTMFEQTATLCYEPLPSTQISFKTIAIYLKKTISMFDLAVLILVSIFLTFLGFITPKMVQIVFSTIVKLKNLKIITLIGIFFLTATISEHYFSIMKILITQKIVTKIVLKLEAAIVLRVISMPTSFFKKFNSGEIFTKINFLKNYCKTLINSVLKTWLSCLLSLTYFFQIFSYAPALTIPTMVVITAFLIFSAFTATTRAKIGFKKMDFSSQEKATTIELISGIEKIKLAGSEKVAFAIWAEKFSKVLKIEYNPPAALKFNIIILNTIKLFGTLATYILAAIYKIEPANFFAFSLTFSIINNAFFNLASTTLELAKMKPISKFLKPIFNCCPEKIENKKILTNLKGSIKVYNLSFSYENNNSSVLNKISFKIQPKQTVAIVGKNGCGKSTLIRLLIGFETPTSGSIFFDENNIELLNLKALRNKIGIVFNNKKLFNSNIFLNIAAKNKNLSLKQAWKAAKIAQIDKEIANMPMKMNTLITQEGKEFSASQVQRILIAQALATRPKILIIDEISDLETAIQQKIFKQLKQLKCTTIVTANNTAVSRFCDFTINLK